LQQWTNFCTNFSPKKWGSEGRVPLSKKIGGAVPRVPAPLHPGPHRTMTNRSSRNIVRPKEFSVSTRLAKQYDQHVRAGSNRPHRQCSQCMLRCGLKLICICSASVIKCQQEVASGGIHTSLLYLNMHSSRCSELYGAYYQTTRYYKQLFLSGLVCVCTFNLELSTCTHSFFDTLSTFKRHLKFHLFQSAFTV